MDMLLWPAYYNMFSNVMITFFKRFASYEVFAYREKKENYSNKHWDITDIFHMKKFKTAWNISGRKAEVSER